MAEASGYPARIDATRAVHAPGYGASAARPDQPVLRWSSRAHSLDEVQRELAKIWTRPPGSVPGGEDGESHVAARTSVLNLVVVARSPEIGQRVAGTILQLTGRHPSRTTILSSTDPDGPRWLDAQVQAFCVAPRADAPETCGELVYLSAGGEVGRHLDALLAPLLIHDLPVTLWWPGEPQFESSLARDLLKMADRVVVDGSSWSGNGLRRLAELARLVERRLAICDFALVRQSRWREAIAATFDVPEFTPFLSSIRRIDVRYSTHDETGRPDGTIVVKPVYHVAWIAARLGMHVVSPLAPRVGSAGDATAGAATDPGTSPDTSAAPALPGGFDATLRHGFANVAVSIRPVISTLPSGTTSSVNLLAQRHGTRLDVEVTAEAETVYCRVRQNGVEVLQRRFHAPRRTDVDLLAEAVEDSGHGPITVETLRMAAALVRSPTDQEPKR